MGLKLSSWVSFPTSQYKRDSKKYSKKKLNEYVAVINNLDTYYKALKDIGNPMQIKSGFIHKEPDGIKAIDQKGGGQKVKLCETRLYVYQEQETKILYLLKIGDKQSQRKIDIKFCREFVKNLRRKAR